MNQKISKLLYTYYLRLAKKPTLECLKLLNETQKLDEDEILQLQFDRLKSMLIYAFENVPFYNHKFRNLKIDPYLIKSSDDLKNFPIIQKNEIRENYDKLVSSEKKQSKRVYCIHTSGSTGIPLKLYRDFNVSAAHWAAAFRGRKWHDIEIGDRSARFWGVSEGYVNRIKEKFGDFILNTVRLTPKKLNAEKAYKFYLKMMKFKPKFIWGYPSAMYQFGKFLMEKGVDGKKINIWKIFSTAEVLHDFQRCFLENYFGCDVIDEYGCNELGNISFECKKGKKHLAAENVYVEILDDNWEKVKNGQIGNIVATSLVNNVMPLIRYVPGDLGCFSGEKCSCGLKLPILEKIVGRSSDYYRKADGDLVHSHVFGYLIKDLVEKFGENCVKQIKFMQTAELEILIKIVKGETFNVKINDYLSKEIKKRIDPKVGIRIKCEKRIEEEKSGKFRYFKSEIGV